jgi:PKD repeat protein
MNFKNFTKLGWVFLLLPFLFISSCKEDVEPIVPVASFQVEVDAEDFLKINTINVSKNVSTYLWDFGDGVGTSTDFEPSYTYAVDGDYVIKLIATDDAGVSAEVTRDVTITDPDKALTLLAGSVSKTWKLVREGAAIGIGPDEANWTQWWALVNDGARNCFYDDEFIFSRDGGFEYKDAGTFFGEGDIYANSTDRIDLAETCFEANETNLTVDGVNMSAWLSSTTHTYAYDVATNKIMLTGQGAWMGLIKLGTDGYVGTPQASTGFGATLVSGGATGVDTLDITFEYPGNYWKARYVSYANPADEPALVAVNANFDVTTAGLTATFTNRSSGATTYAWDFGDGESSTDENPSHTYAADGTYSVTLTASDGSDSGTVTKDVIIDTANPAEAAPTPTEDAANVISIFSDAYSAIDGVNTNPDWGQATVVTDEVVAGDNILKLAGLNYQGIDWTATAGGSIDVTGKTMVHVDIWTKAVETINFSLIGGGAENAVSLTTEAGTWTSFDIALSEYTAPDKSAVIQFKFDDAGSGTSPTLFVDNMYFY